MNLVFKVQYDTGLEGDKKPNAQLLTRELLSSPVLPFNTFNKTTLVEEAVGPA